jgi:fumarate reductase flavoprotein subunit
LVRALENQCEKLDVEILLNTACRKLYLDQNDKLDGLYAERDGAGLFIEARSVIIATGGYGGNLRLLKEHCPFYDESIKCLGLPHAGDGMFMATDIGAAPASLGTLLLEWPHVHGDKLSILSTLAREPYAIYVNKTGRRFIDEEKGMHAFECAHAVLRQQQKTSYIILDDAIIDHIQQFGAVLGRGDNRAERRRSMPGLKELTKLLAQSDNTSLIISESISDIARWIGSEPRILSETISEYNVGCEHGYDQIFFKDRQYLKPIRQLPYYVIKGDIAFLHTMGGISINQHMEVLDKNGKPINGVYAAGADTGGWEPDTYCDRFSGTVFGFAVNSGRIAAENAVRYCK